MVKKWRNKREKKNIFNENQSFFFLEGQWKLKLKISRNTDIILYFFMKKKLEWRVGDILFNQ